MGLVFYSFEHIAYDLSIRYRRNRVLPVLQIYLKLNMIFLLFYLLSLIQTSASFLLSSFLSFKALQIYQFNFFIQVPHVIHVLEVRRMKDLKIPQESVKVLANNLTNITPHVNWFRDVLNFYATVKSVGEIFTKMRFTVFRVC